jgi:hypothetical protein
VIRRLRATIDGAFGDLSKRERDYLREVGDKGGSPNRTAAAVLGLDLWRDEIETWRKRFAEEPERPSMWRFAFGPSARWDVRAWRDLSLEARILRAEVGPLAHEVGPDGLVRAGPETVTVGPPMDALRKGGFASGEGDGLRFRRLASPDELVVDLALVVIVGHWIASLAVADHIADNSSTDHVEVHGYAGVCRFCRERWGVQIKERWSLPPFHPACRCFAQPAYQAKRT